MSGRLCRDEANHQADDGGRSQAASAKFSQPKFTFANGPDRGGLMIKRETLQFKTLNAVAKLLFRLGVAEFAVKLRTT